MKIDSIQEHSIFYFAIYNTFFNSLSYDKNATNKHVFRIANTNMQI
jgi:hypothetical protein